MKQNNRRWVMAGALGCLVILLVCILGVWFLCLGGSDALSNVPRPPSPAPQPKVAISAQNHSQIALLYQLAITDSIHTLAWSPDSRWIAIGAGQFVGMGSIPNASVHLWDITNGQGRVIYTHPLHNGPVADVEFSPDGKILAFADSGTEIKVWNIASNAQLRLLTSAKSFDPNNLVFSPDGTMLLAIGSSDEPKMWEVATGRELPTTIRQNGNLISPDWKTVVKSIYNREANPPTYQLKLFDPASGNERGTIGGTLPVVFSHNGQWIASVEKTSIPGKPNETQASILLTNVQNNQVSVRLDGNVNPQTRLAFSPDDALFVAQTTSPAMLGPFPIVQTNLWQVSSGTKFTIPGIIGYYSFSPDGRYLAIGSIDGKLQLWGIKP